MKRVMVVIGLVLGCVTTVYAKPLHLAPIGPAFACRSIAHAQHCVVINVQGYEVATTLSIPNAFSPNTVIQSALVNGNFSTIASWANGNVDSTNVGTAGIGANQIKSGCSGCTGTFSFAATFANTVTFNPNAAGSIPVSITNAGSPTAHYLDVTKNGGTAGGLFNIDKNGLANTSGIIYATPNATPTASAVWCQNDNAATNGLSCNVPTGSTNGFLFDVNNASVAQITTAGSVIGACTGCAVTSYAEFVYTTSGAAVGSTWHQVGPFLVSDTLASSCASLALCVLTTGVVNFTGSAVFTSSSSYGCNATNTVGNNFYSWGVNPQSGSQIQYLIRNVTGSTILVAGQTPSAFITCSGT